MKHLADHRSSSTGAKLKHFLRLARNRGEAVWERVRQGGRGAANGATGNRRLVEFARIERNRRG